MATYSSSDLMLHGSKHLVRLLLERRARLELFRQEVSNEVIGRDDAEYYRPPADEAYVANTPKNSFLNQAQSWVESRPTVHRLWPATLATVRRRTGNFLAYDLRRGSPRYGCR